VQRVPGLPRSEQGAVDRVFLALTRRAAGTEEDLGVFRLLARLRALVRAVDELIAQRVVSDDAWRALAGELTANQFVEFCMLVGHYLMVAMTINSCGLALEPGYLDELPGDPGKARA
jgi:hypothetical protein